GPVHGQLPEGDRTHEPERHRTIKRPVIACAGGDCQAVDVERGAAGGESVAGRRRRVSREHHWDWRRRRQRCSRPPRGIQGRGLQEVVVIKLGPDYGTAWINSIASPSGSSIMTARVSPNA